MEVSVVQIASAVVASGVIGGTVKPFFDFLSNRQKTNETASASQLELANKRIKNLEDKADENVDDLAESGRKDEKIKHLETELLTLQAESDRFKRERDEARTEASEGRRVINLMLNKQLSG